LTILITVFVSNYSSAVECNKRNHDKLWLEISRSGWFGNPDQVKSPHQDEKKLIEHAKYSECGDPIKYYYLRHKARYGAHNKRSGFDFEKYEKIANKIEEKKKIEWEKGRLERERKSKEERIAKEKEEIKRIAKEKEEIKRISKVKDKIKTLAKNLKPSTVGGYKFFKFGTPTIVNKPILLTQCQQVSKVVEPWDGLRGITGTNCDYFSDSTVTLAFTNKKKLIYSLYQLLIEIKSFGRSDKSFTDKKDQDMVDLRNKIDKKYKLLYTEERPCKNTLNEGVMECLDKDQVYYKLNCDDPKSFIGFYDNGGVQLKYDYCPGGTVHNLDLNYLDQESAKEEFYKFAKYNPPKVVKKITSDDL